MIQVKERCLSEVREHYFLLKTDLMKMEYLESVLKTSGVGIDVKIFAFGALADLYKGKMMFDKAAKAMYSKAGFDITYREKVDSFLKSAEYYIRAGSINGAEDMFVAASREANSEQRNKIILFRKYKYIEIADELEKKLRMSSAVKIYEHLLTMKLSDDEKIFVKNKMIAYYNRIGRFADAKLVEKR